MRHFVLLALLAALCACREKAAPAEDFYTRDVTLPNGQVIRCESMFDATDMMRGLMFRKALAPDRGMLFQHRSTGLWGYWMYQVLIPLDMIWMDSSHRVVGIVREAPPCKTEASQCPHYGDQWPAQYVLQLAGGMANRYNIQVGDYIGF